MAVSGPCLIRGVVLASGGGPLAGARVFCLSGPVPLPDIAALTRGDGAFSLTAPVAGAYEVGAAADGFEQASVGVAVAERQTAHVTLRLQRA
jgi:hypothetical protein